VNAARSAGDGCSEVFALRQGVFKVALGDGGVQLLVWHHAERLERLGPAELAVVERLAERGSSEQELRAVAGACGGEADVPGLLERLVRGGWLTVTVTWAGRALYSLHPLRPPPAPPSRGPAAQDLALSRFALLRAGGEGLVALSPRAWCEVHVHDAGATTVLGELAGSAPADGVVSPDVHRRMLRDLEWAGLAVARPGAEDAELRLRQWSPHELWFHERSRLGHRGYGGEHFGPTSWARDEFPPPPARHESLRGPGVDLHRPDLEELRAGDRTLTAVLEDRRSFREHDDEHPLTADQLGEFLFRCGRTRGIRARDGVEYLDRPYPAGGSAYELELYPVVRHVAGLAPALYRYDPDEHRLVLVREPGPPVRRLLRVASVVWQRPAPPQVLIVVAARFGRVMWTYEAMAYALVLKHVGVLLQTMYAVATAMDLAPCGLGAGDAVDFAQATGLDPLVESSVGEFALGSRPPGAGRSAA
jgi:SagB-type dehydrogenase family enzyme